MTTHHNAHMTTMIASSKFLITKENLPLSVDSEHIIQEGRADLLTEVIRLISPSTTKRSIQDHSSCNYFVTDAMDSPQGSTLSDLETFFLQTSSACHAGGRRTRPYTDGAEWLLSPSASNTYEDATPLLTSSSSTDRHVLQSCDRTNGRMKWKRNNLRRRRKENRMMILPSVKTLISRSCSVDHQHLNRSSVGLRSLPRDLEIQRLEEDDHKEERKSRFIRTNLNETCILITHKGNVDLFGCSERNLAQPAAADIVNGVFLLPEFSLLDEEVQ